MRNQLQDAHSVSTIVLNLDGNFWAEDIYNVDYSTCSISRVQSSGRWQNYAVLDFIKCASQPSVRCLPLEATKPFNTVFPSQILELHSSTSL